MNHYHDIIEIIDYYILGNLVYYTHSINIDSCTEYYNNLVKIDDLTYTIRSRGWDIIYTPDLLRDHLELLPKPVMTSPKPGWEIKLGKF